MKYCEIVPDPANQSHYVVVDGIIYSRHTDVKAAETVRTELVSRLATPPGCVTASEILAFRHRS